MHMHDTSRQDLLPARARSGAIDALRVLGMRPSSSGTSGRTPSRSGCFTRGPYPYSSSSPVTFGLRGAHS